MNGTSAKLLVAGVILAVSGSNSIGTVSAQLAQGQAQSQRAVVVSEAVSAGELQAAAEVAAYWTPERLATARPVDLRADLNELASEPLEAATGAVVSAEGARPAIAVAPNNGNFLLNPATVPAYEEEGVTSGEDEPGAYGTSLRRYSNTRNVPFAASTDNAYPHRTIGKWFFTRPGVGNFVCSASVIQRRIVATAGHCLHPGNGNPNSWYINRVFVPSYRTGAAPFGLWTANRCSVTATWFNGGGGVPNAADYGMCDMNDRLGSRIGIITGWLGWRTLSLASNHAHIFGYPGNLDNGLYMNQNSAGAGPFNGNNTYIYGSPQRGGVSGGPYIQNYGIAPACSSGCTASLAGRNQVIGVASYIPVSTFPHYVGASVLDSRWVAVWNAVCAFRAGNCA